MRSAPHERLLILDLLESYAREREIQVMLERPGAGEGWVCALSTGDLGLVVRSRGSTAREAITGALRQAGVEIPG
jgi:hypothetical protein